MNQNKTLRLICLLFLLTMQLFHTSGQNKWEGYYSYKNCFDLLETDDLIVGVTDLGIILFYKESGIISVKNKINGLSDSGISAVGKVEGQNTILIGYENGNIDIIKDGKVINIPDLKIQNMAWSKTINDFLHSNGKVYCSADFGILQLDLNKLEIASSFIVGKDASYVKVYRTTINGEYIYAATASGILRANIGDALAYYKNWNQFSETSDAFCAVAAFGDGILAAKGIPGNSCNLMKINENGSSTIIGTYNRFRNLSISGDKTFVTTQNKIYSFNSSLSIVEEIDSVAVSGKEQKYLPSYRSTSFIGNSGICFSDWNGGFFIEKTDGDFEQILPNGPYSNKVFKTETVNNELWIVPGGFGSLYDNGNVEPSISILKDGEWLSFNRSNTPEFSNVRDLINIEVNPLDADNVFVSSWGNGVFEFDEENDTIHLKHHYVEENSELMNYPNTTKDRYIRIWGLTFDKNGNLFMNNSDVQRGIVVYDKKNNIWYHIDSGVLAQGYQKVGEILIDDQGYKWMPIVSGEKGLFIFDDNGTISNPSDDRYRSRVPVEKNNDIKNAGALELWDENGEQLTEIIYCLAKDKNGYIWIGTDIGILVQYDPYNIFNIETPVFTRIKVPRNDGSGLADYLLENQEVTAIAVDNANRKYCGTGKSGIYLISEDGTKTVEHFTSANSPLPSDNIVSINIDENNGKVYIATDKGLISFQGDAVKGESTFSDVYVYPNPVRPGYEGNMTITGLIDQTNVKITDTAGNLVYETISLGGNALWNGKNLWGQKVKPGIYIVFLTSPNGSQSESTKIAIIR